MLRYSRRELTTGPGGAVEMEEAHKDHVISYKRIREFLESHPEHAQCEPALYAWYKNAVESPWTNFGRVRETYGGADMVGKYVVFNISGNKIRLVAEIKFHLKPRLIYIRRVLTHAEYDEIDLEA
jgi:mRNA interferase HigB